MIHRCQIFALLIAVGLGGAYAWKRQQQALPRTDTSEESAGSSRTGSDSILPIPESADRQQADRILMPGSKSSVISDSGIFKDEGRTLMPGSKIGIIKWDSMDKILVPSPEDPVPEERRTLLPGSKTTDGILSPKDIVHSNNDVLPEP
jgi:hypothetical protein